MLAHQRAALADMLRSAIQEIAEQSSLGGLTLLDVLASLHQPKQAEHGDQATGIALRLAKPLGRKPPDVARALVERLTGQPSYRALVAREEIAGPGFVNFTLTDQARGQVLGEIISQGERFGHQPPLSAGSVLLEFVSANPTGPLHVGHGRQAALGDSLANILASQGARVHREFYYNDAGAQIQNLALSVQSRAKGLAPEDPDFPADGYRGDYVIEIAKAYMSGQTVVARDAQPIVGAADENNLESIRHFAVTALRHEQDLDLTAFGVVFDQFSLESALYENGSVDEVVDELARLGHAYEQDGALWLRSTAFGDDKDRVMRKSDGSYTYFVPDVAYHLGKWRRGFDRAINIQGSDHHGTVARVRAGLQALDCGIPPGFPDYVLHKMVTVMRAGQEVKISKRAGSYVTLRDLIQWSGELRNEQGDLLGVDEAKGRDAVRFFLVSRKAETEFVFDVDLALSRSDDNPVYYIQYAHARVMQVLSQAGWSWTQALEWLDGLSDPDLQALKARLVSAREAQLCRRLAEYPACLALAAQELSPHHLAFYLRELAADLHGFYNTDRVLIDDESLKRARLALLICTATVLRAGTRLLGVSCPDRM